MTSKCLILDVFNSDTAADSNVTADSIEFNVSYCHFCENVVMFGSFIEFSPRFSSRAL